MKEIIELKKLVIKTIRAWHGMEKVCDDSEEMMWGIYNRNSPEMKRINQLFEQLDAISALQSQGEENYLTRDHICFEHGHNMFLVCEIDNGRSKYGDHKCSRCGYMEHFQFDYFI